MRREEVKENLKKIKAEIATIKNDDEPVVYITQTKFLDGIGYISEISTIEELVKAHAKVIKKTHNDYSESITELGITIEELPSSDVKILGYKPSHWIKDIKTRLTELRKKLRLEKLEVAEKTLNKFLSADDQFELQTQGIEELIG